MTEFTGKSVYKGITLGPVIVWKDSMPQIRRGKAENTDAEIRRLEQAIKQSQEQLQGLHNKAVKEIGEDHAAIFEVHQMMLEDEDYLNAIHSMIQTEMVNAEYAVLVTGNNFSEMFAGMDDAYMKARAADVGYALENDAGGIGLFRSEFLYLGRHDEEERICI